MILGLVVKVFVGIVLHVRVLDTHVRHASVLAAIISQSHLK